MQAPAQHPPRRAPQRHPFDRLRAEAEASDLRTQHAMRHSQALRPVLQERDRLQQALLAHHLRHYRRGWVAGVRHAMRHWWLFGLVCGLAWGAAACVLLGLALGVRLP